jgi:hypothetical protein
MQCPACGSDIDEDVVFCPHCRYQFGVPEDDVIFENAPDPSPRTPAFGGSDKRFSAKEIRFAKVLLLQPVILLTIAIAGALYLASPRIGQMSIMVSAMEIFYGGALCLVAGAVVAGIIYLVIAYRLGRS